MTKSQWATLIATVATMAATIEAKAALLTAVLPPPCARWVPLVVILAGIVTAARNQSLSTNHVSIPVELAKAKGIDPSLHGGKSE